MTIRMAFLAAVAFILTIPHGMGSSSARVGVLQLEGGKEIGTLSMVDEPEKSTLRRTMVFTDRGGKQLCSEYLVWNPGSLLLDKFESVDKRTGKVESYVRTGSSYVATYRKNSSSKTEKETFESEKNMMPAPMVSIFLASRIEDLSAGKEVEFRLLVAERMDTYGFQAEKTAEETVSGVKTIKVTVTASSFLIHQLAGKLSFSIEKAPPHRLMKFTGRLPLTDDDGSAQMGSITYK